MKKLITILCGLFLFAMGMAQTTVSGTVMDSEGNEPLIGATVVVDGASIGTVTDAMGKFSLNVPDGYDRITIQYVGYGSQTLTLAEAQGSTIRLSSDSYGLDAVVVTGFIDVVRDRRTPVAVSTISKRDIQAKAVGNVEFPEVMKNTPSVYVAQQTGFGDSQMFLRGFDQINTAFLLNGQPINGMEDGRMYWSNWSGMSDVANVVQVQRGLGSSKLAISSVGGTVNIVTRTIDKEQGGFVRFMYGNDNYLKGTVSYNSGLKGKWAYSLMVDHWQADNKWAEGTEGQGQNYFLSVGFKPNDNHNLNFLVTGAPQWHGQRWSQSLETLEETPKFNQHWGEYNGDFETERRNYYHKPVINLSWDYDISDRTNLSSVLYASFGRGGGTGNYGSNRIRTADGQVDWDAIDAANSADDDGIGMFSDNYALRASVNNHQWYGNVTNLEYTINDNWTWNVGGDLRFYTGDHFRQLVELFGLDSYQDSFRHATRGSDYTVSNTYKARPWAALFDFADEGDRIAYDYSETINYLGGFTQLEYTEDRFTAFVQGAVSNQTYQREGRWADIGESDEVSKSGFNVKGGASYSLSDNSTIFANAGFYSRQPFLDNIFEDIRYSNTLLTPDIDNEEITGIEGGYKYTGNDIVLNFNVYSTTWGNRTRVSTFSNDNGTPDDESDDFNQRDVERGIEQVHNGAEIDLQYRLSKRFQLNGYLSMGDWTFNEIESVTSFNDDTGVLIGESAGIDAEGVHVQSAPQSSYGVGIKSEIIDGLNFYADYNFFDNIYIRTRDAIPTADIGTLDGYGLLDLGASYGFNLGDQNLEIRTNVYNVLDNDAINQSDRFGFFNQNGTTWNASVRLNF